MTFKQSVLICLGPKYLFKIQGRASRSEYWWFALFICLVNIASAVFWIFPPAVAASLNFLVGLVLFPASFGVTVRRLHDRNLSGWWLLTPLCLIVSGIMAAPAAQLALMDIFSFLLCVAFIIVFCMPGQPGVNRFGANPLPPVQGIGQEQEKNAPPV